MGSAFMYALLLLLLAAFGIDAAVVKIHATWTGHVGGFGGAGTVEILRCMRYSFLLVVLLLLRLKANRLTAQLIFFHL